MASFKDETVQYHKERVREVLVLKPNASMRAIREALEGDPRSPLTLDRHYIGKLVRKIHAERAQRYNTAIVESRLAEIQDRTQGVVEQMWRILLDGTADGKGRVMAGKVIIDAEHKLLEAQMNAGIFERKLGTVEVSHEHKLNPDLAAPILRALRNYGIVNPTTAVVPYKPAELAQPAHAAGSGAAHQ